MTLEHLRTLAIVLQFVMVGLTAQAAWRLRRRSQELEALTTRLAAGTAKSEKTPASMNFRRRDRHRHPLHHPLTPMLPQTPCSLPRTPCSPLVDLPDVAISFRQPWAWLVTVGPKDIENRPWLWTKGLGRFLVHASAGMTKGVYGEAWRFAADRGVVVPAFADIEPGEIVGVVRHEGPVLGPGHSGHPWHMTGQIGYPITDRRPLPFVACLGALGRWKVPAAVLAELRQKLDA